MNTRKTPDDLASTARHRVPARALAAAAALALSWAAPPVAADANPAAKTDAPKVSPELRRIAEGLLKNRAAFRSFRCEFGYRIGQAASLQEALKKGPTVKPLAASCTWLADGKSVCYSRVIDEKAQAAMKKALATPRREMVAGQPGFVAQIPLDALGWLTDGTRALRYDPDFAANLMGPKRIDKLIEGLSPHVTPWGLAGMGLTVGSNPGRWILDGKWGKWRFLGAEKTKEGELLTAECRRESSRTKYYFDPQRGFLSVRKEYRLTDGRSAHVAVLDVRKCSGGRWFPARVVRVDMRAGGAIWRVQEIVVTALDADSKLKRDEMFLTLRRGIKLLHVDNLLSSSRLRAAERVGIDDLEALHARCNEVLQRRLRDRASKSRQ